MFTRRHVLAVVVVLSATLAVTGCIWNTSSNSSMVIELEEVPREQLGGEEAVSPSEMEPRVRETVRDGLANGTTVYGRKPLDEEAVVVSNGSYYAVRVTADGTATVERPVLEAEAVPAPNGSVSDWGNLSRSDSRTLRCAVATSDRATDSCVIYRGTDSAFWPELRFQYLETGDSAYYRLHTAMQTVTLARYHYSFERVAPNRSAFIAYFTRDRIMRTANLSTDQREILRTAAADGEYRESPPYSDGFEYLVERIARASDDRTVYLRFNGTYYEATAWRSSAG